MTDHCCDVLVVGSGLCGGVAAKELTENGLDVVVLEAGPDSPDRTAEVDKGYTTPLDKPYSWNRIIQLGGRSTQWNRHTYRHSDFEFKAASLDGLGADWPLSYEDLAPYYDKVEEFIGVEGSSEGLPQLPDGKFLPGAPLLAGEERVRTSLAKHFPGQTLIRARRVVRRHPRQRLSSSRYPFFASPGSFLAAAQATGRLRLLLSCRAHRIELDAERRRAVGVLYKETATGAEHMVRAKVIMLCASTLESTRLLLNSYCDDFPEGLCNSSGVLGHYLTDHAFAKVVCGIIEDLESFVPVGDDALQFLIPRYQNLGRRTHDFDRGYGIQGWIQSNLSGVIPALGAFPGCAHFLANVFCETVPRYENHVALNMSRSDAWGIPLLHIESSFGENERKLHAHAVATMTEIFEACDGFILADDLNTEIAPPGHSVHEVGTARMGSSPKDSVLNPFCQSWDVDNLFVTDGAAFVSLGVQNPALTMMALTARSADYILREYKKTA